MSRLAGLPLRVFALFIRPPKCCLRPLAWGPPSCGALPRARLASPGGWRSCRPGWVATPGRSPIERPHDAHPAGYAPHLVSGLPGRRWVVSPRRRAPPASWRPFLVFLALPEAGAAPRLELGRGAGASRSPAKHRPSRESRESDVRSQKSRKGVKTGPDHPKKHGGEPGPPPRKASPRIGEAAFGRGRWNRGSVRRERPRPKSWPECRWGCDERPPSHNQERC